MVKVAVPWAVGSLCVLPGVPTALSQPSSPVPDLLVPSDLRPLPGRPPGRNTPSPRDVPWGPQPWAQRTQGVVGEATVRQHQTGGGGPQSSQQLPSPLLFALRAFQ